MPVMPASGKDQKLTTAARGYMNILILDCVRVSSQLSAAVTVPYALAGAIPEAMKWVEPRRDAGAAVLREGAAVAWGATRFFMPDSAYQVAASDHEFVVLGPGAPVYLESLEG